MATTATLDVEVVVLDKHESATVEHVIKKPRENDVVKKELLFRTIKDAHHNGIRLDSFSEELEI